VEWEASTTLLGLSLILIGVALVLLPLLTRALQNPAFESIPWILLYVYRSDGFVFATSHILILLSVLVYLYSLWRR